MNLSIVATLDNRYTKKDRTCAIIVRIGRNNQTLPISTRFSVPVAFWDEKKRQVKNNYPGVSSVARLNNQIEAEVKAVKDIALELDEAGILDTLSLKEIKARVVQAKKGGLFFAHAECVLKDLEKAKRIGTKNAYADAVRALENFHGSRDLQLKEITYAFLKKFETAHYANENKSKATKEKQKEIKLKDNTANGLAAYLRAIRAIYNSAIKEGLVPEKYYPFKKYKIQTEPTKKRALEWELLSRILTLKLAPSDQCFNARNYFVASFMMYGMNFTDMAYLKKSENIIDGRISYRRSKTSKLYDIKISPALNEIIYYYVKLNSESDFIFPIIKREASDEQDKDIKWARKRYNKKLKLIAQECDIQENLTSYVSRHSFATQAMLQEVPVKAISTMLGHSSLKTTETYLASLPSNILDDYNERILSGQD